MQSVNLLCVFNHFTFLSALSFHIPILFLFNVQVSHVVLKILHFWSLCFFLLLASSLKQIFKLKSHTILPSLPSLSSSTWKSKEYLLEEQ